MKDWKKITNQLTYRLEFFTGLIPLPTIIYFISVFGSRAGTQDNLHISISGFLSGILTIIWGIYLRNSRLKKLFSELQKVLDNSSNAYEKKETKLRILNFPIVETQTIIARWVFGLGGGLSIFYILSGTMPVGIFYTTNLGLLFVLPISIVMYLYTTEKYMAILLRIPEVTKIQVPIKRVRFLGASKRIFLAIFSVAIIPTTIFGYIIYYVIHDGLSLGNPAFHISILSFLSLLSMVIVSGTFANSLRESLQYNNETLLKISRGSFQEDSSVYSTDEFGHQGYLIGTVIRSLRKLYGQIFELNQELEQKVSERTRELSDSLEILTRLKKQQDGDYYLTSLLLRPLGMNTSNPVDVKVNYITEQYKKFQFQKWNSEIGGDLCRADTVRLRGRNLTVFLSADAMGKSIQGAGGALVLGAVFDSLIERTRLEEAFQKYYPERWLKKAFVELHKVFESFDGTMLTSIVLGMVENETGFLYYIDAEHPDPVLYRDGVAEFLVPEKHHRKLGAHVGNQPLQFTCFQLKQGDIFIVGSDGRDDVLIDDSGEERMNYDRDLFLKTVKDGSGNIHKILEIIKSRYRLTDDISLLSVQIPENKKSPEETWSGLDFDKENGPVPYKKWEMFLGGEIQNPYEWRQMGLQFLRQKDFLKSLLCLEKYSDLIPSDNKNLHILSYLHQKVGNFIESIEVAERLRVRDSMDWRNLLRVCKIYIAVGNFQRAKSILNQVESMLEEGNFPVFLPYRIASLRNKIEMREKKIILP